MKRLKEASKDFTTSHLPSNRVEVFLDVIKNRWRTLLGMGVILFLFMLPLLVVSTIEEMISVQILGRAADGIIETDIAATYMQTTYFISGIIKIIGWGIFSIGISGSARIIKRLIWAEGIQFSYDFTSGIRENGKKMFQLFIIVGAVLMVWQMAPYSLSHLSGLSEIEYSITRSIIVATGLLLMLPIGAFTFSQIIFYENKLITMVINSVAFLGKTLLKTYVFVMGFAVSSVLIMHFANMTTRVIITGVASVFVIPLVVLIWLLYSSYVFDKFVNSRFYPEIVDKGIWRKE